jgi:hypothetical protein
LHIIAFAFARVSIFAIAVAVAVDVADAELSFEKATLASSMEEIGWRRSNFDSSSPDEKSKEEGMV